AWNRKAPFVVPTASTTSPARPSTPFGSAGTPSPPRLRFSQRGKLGGGHGPANTQRVTGARGRSPPVAPGPRAPLAPRSAAAAVPDERRARRAALRPFGRDPRAPAPCTQARAYAARPVGTGPPCGAGSPGVRG